MSSEQENDNLSLAIIKKLRAGMEIHQNTFGAEKVYNTNLVDSSQRRTDVSNSFNVNKNEVNKLQTYSRIDIDDHSNHDQSRHDSNYHLTDNSRTVKDSFNRRLNYKNNHNRLIQKSTVVIVSQSKPSLTNCKFYKSQLILIDGRSSNTKALPPAQTNKARMPEHSPYLLRNKSSGK